MLISAKTTSAPTALTAFAVAAKVKDGSMTSSPCCILHAISDARRAEVPELTAITSLTVRFASFRTSATAFISSSPTKGLFIGTLTPSIAELDAGGKLLGLAKVVLSHASFNQYPLHN